MQITLLAKKTGFGCNKLIYPACEKSKIFAAMLGQKTFTGENLAQIEGLGFTINLINSLPAAAQSAAAMDQEIFKNFN